ncbi:MAG: alpha/beta hydrolase, partial [Erythrobacter sp.]|nr:alpha/beta hydrolase [Erythrobacter sp.]
MKRFAFFAALGAAPGLILSLALSLTLMALPAHGQTPVTKVECPPYESFGNGPDLILTPGLGSAPGVWDSVKAELSKTHTLHLVHVAGFAGRAPTGEPDTIISRAAEEIVAYMDCKGIVKAAYAGHSMGGFLGLKLASEHPERIERLVVVDSLPFYSLIFSPAATPEAVAPQADMFRSQILAAEDAAFEVQQRQGVRSLVKTADKHDTVVGWSL